MKKDPLRIQAHVILGTLIVQYLLGMFANMFVTFPDTSKEATLWEFAKAQPSIMTHIVLAALLVIGGIVLLIRAIRKKDKQWIIAGSVGLFGLLAGGIAGARFIPTQQDGYSFIMAVAFIVSFVAYGWGIYKGGK